MFLHALQAEFGYLSKEAIEWTAAKLELQPINVYELVTFYPMFRQEPAGKYQIKVCRTLSCALAGSKKLHDHFCTKFGFDAHSHGVQTSKDGKFSVEFVECLASIAGDHALTVMARGGVYLVGGVITRILPSLQEGRFGEFFCAKGPHSAMMMKIPTLMSERSLGRANDTASVTTDRPMAAATVSNRIWW